MLRIALISLFVLFLSGNKQLSAQCIDSTHIQYGGYCDPQWIPVCGCNGVTYRNDCFSRNAGLVSWNYGICDAIDFDFNPNPPSNDGYIDIHAIMRTPGYMNVQLVDRFGRIYYSTAFSNISDFTFQINVKGFPAGMYLLNLWCNDGFKVKKIVVIDFQ